MLAQQNSGVLKGRVYNAKTNEGVPFASVVVWGTTTGAMTDFDGNFTFNNVKPGEYKITTSYISYQPVSKTLASGSIGKALEVSRVARDKAISSRRRVLVGAQVVAAIVGPGLAVDV